LPPFISAPRSSYGCAMNRLDGADLLSCAWRRQAPMMRGPTAHGHRSGPA
jgi:hypothetical protein